MSNNFENSVKDQLNQAMVTPPDQVWSRLDRSLDKMNPVGPSIKGLKIGLSTVAILICLGTLYYIDNKQVVATQLPAKEGVDLESEAIGIQSDFVNSASEIEAVASNISHGNMSAIEPTVQASIVEPQIQKEMEEKIELTSPEQTQHVPIYLPAIEPLHIPLASQISNSITHQPSTEHEAAKEQKFTVGINTTLSPLLFCNRFKQSEMNNFYESYGIYGKYRLNDKISIGLGVNHSMLFMQYEYLDLVHDWTISGFHAHLGGTIVKSQTESPLYNWGFANSEVSTEQVEKVKLNYSKDKYIIGYDNIITCIEIPMTMTYRLRNGRLTFDVFAGINNIFITNISVYDDISDMYSRNEYDHVQYSTYNIGLLCGVEFEYRMGKHLGIMFNPTYKKYSKLSTESVMTYSPSVLGCALGFGYHF